MYDGEEVLITDPESLLDLYTTREKFIKIYFQLSHKTCKIVEAYFFI